jgi:hypothetical protein
MRDVDGVAVDELDAHWTPTSSKNGSSRAPRSAHCGRPRTGAPPTLVAFGVSFRSNKLFDAGTEAKAVSRHHPSSMEVIGIMRVEPAAVWDVTIAASQRWRH